MYMFLVKMLCFCEQVLGFVSFERNSGGRRREKYTNKKKRKNQSTIYLSIVSLACVCVCVCFFVVVFSRLVRGQTHTETHTTHPLSTFSFYSFFLYNNFLLRKNDFKNVTCHNATAIKITIEKILNHWMRASVVSLVSLRAFSLCRTWSNSLLTPLTVSSARRKSNCKGRKCSFVLAESNLLLSFTARSSSPTSTRWTSLPPLWKQIL